jgi:KipI family sensor histidine kinase inhibitor
MTICGVESSGDSALVVRVTATPGDLTATIRQVRAVAAAVTAAALPEVIDVVPSPDRVTVIYDPRTVTDPDDLASQIGRLVAAAEGEPTLDGGTRHQIAVCYADGPDLDAACIAAGLDRDAFVQLHASPEYLVVAIGFVPGFAYLGGLPSALALPRRATPRPRVPVGSVGIGGSHTGIYPHASPGGWHLVGRSVAPLFDPHRTPPALLAVGDRVRFTPVEALPAIPETPVAKSEPFLAARNGLLTVLAPGLQTTVQDLGRPGHRAAGVAAGGPADRVGLLLANRIVGNPDSAAALEFPLVGPVLRFENDAVIALGGAAFSGLPRGRPMRVTAGSVVDLGHALLGCRGYLAVAGGLDVPAVLGGRGTYLYAGFGGLHGRPLAVGDRLPLGAADTWPEGDDWSLDPELFAAANGPHELRIITSGSNQRLLHHSHRVSARSDRMGLRLEPLDDTDAVDRPSPATGAGADAVSFAVLPGTVQVPPDGWPIVLLADAHTIGGYPVAGHVIAADLPRAGQLRPGDLVRFVAVSHPAARLALRRQEADLARVRHGLAARMRPRPTIDLNCDLGEGAGHDEAMVPLVTSVNIACGGHAGDEATMRRVALLARRHGVAVGAHPGHADRASFGRREWPIAPEAAADLVAEQVARLRSVAGPLAHVKLHGGLYHQAGRDRQLAEAIAARLVREHPGILVVAAAGSVLAAVARGQGLPVAEEAFADRAYGDDGRLVPRTAAGAVIADPAAVAAQAVMIAAEGRVTTASGRDDPLRADTLCVHGDGPDPVACLQAIHAAFARAGIALRAPA